MRIAGSSIGSSSGRPLAVPAIEAPSRTVVFDPSTRKVVDAGDRKADHVVIMNPATGQIIRISS
jgi:hypothetical protein